MFAIQFDPAEWGTVADWVSGLGTIGALLFAAFAVRHDLNSRREDEEHAAWVEAHKVSLDARVSWGQREKDGTTAPEVFGEGRIYLANNSDRVIREATVTTTRGETTLDVMRLGDVLPGGCPVMQVSWSWEPGTEPTGAAAITARFTDLGARRWAVNGAGTLWRE